MRKDIEWLKEEVNKILRDKVSDAINYYDYMDLKNSLNELIDQLDGSEVLTQEWMDNNVVHVRGLGDIVKAEAVESLLVPNQELPVIPKFVADYIVKQKSFDSSLVYVISQYLENGIEDKKVVGWIYGNFDVFVKAWLDGFTVGEEQKYYVLDSEDIPLLEKVNNHTCKTTTGLSIYEDGRDNSRFELTEQEIKDYDERFWVFAIPVEEVE